MLTELSNVPHDLWTSHVCMCLADSASKHVIAAVQSVSDVQPLSAHERDSWADGLNTVSSTLCHCFWHDSR